MPIKPFDGIMPRIHPAAWVSDMAYIVGDVEIGENSSIWPCAVLRGDTCKIVIGKNCNVQDNANVHGFQSVTIGDNVLIGHGAVVHGRRIGNNCLIGVNCTILENAEIGDFCIIGANTLVSANMKISSGSFVVGVPAEIKGPITPEQRQRLENVGRGYVELARKYREQGL